MSFGSAPLGSISLGGAKSSGNVTAIAISGNVIASSVDTVSTSQNINLEIFSVVSRTYVDTLGALNAVTFEINGNQTNVITGVQNTSSDVTVVINGVNTTANIETLADSRSYGWDITYVSSTGSVGSITTHSDISLSLFGNSADVLAYIVGYGENKNIDVIGNEAVTKLENFKSVSVTYIAQITDAELTRIIANLDNINELSAIDFKPIIKALEAIQNSISYNGVYDTVATTATESVINAITKIINALTESTIPNKSDITSKLKTANTTLSDVINNQNSITEIQNALETSKSNVSIAATLYAIYKPIISNGKNVARLSDICTGHGCFPSRFAISASDNVIINNRGAHRMADSWAEHTCKTTHGSVLNSGSGSIYVNNMQLGRVGDPVACGSFVSSGSEDVFAGD